MNLWASLLIALCGSPQEAVHIEYRVSFENAVHHEATIEITCRNLPAEPATFVMSRSSPGRYAIHQFAKNVYRVRATDAGGNELPLEHPTPHEWVVAEHEGEIRLRYDLFGDLVDGTYVAFDRDHAHMNMPATFMWVRGHGDVPITLQIQPLHDDWKVATQLETTDDPFVFRAPNLAYFLDSPTEVSHHDVRSWEIDGEHGAQTVRLALHHLGTDEELDVFAAMAARVVREQKQIFGDYPKFDFGSYTFIADYTPYVSGDGMEHRNSTILTSTRPLSLSTTSNLGTLSHEFFHCWNVERLRPKSLEPFDFERPNPSRELWFAEGFTNYYDDLTIHRAGLSSLEDYAQGLQWRINTVTNRPGRRIRSAADMSELAVFVDAARSVDPQNTANTFISYYTFGDAIGLGLDLTLRVRHQKNLDDFMALVWSKHGVDESLYDNYDLLKAMSEYVSDEFAEDFFKRYIFGREIVPYGELLESAGLVLKKRNPGRAYIGTANLRFRNDAIVVSDRTSIGSPLYQAGIDIGCRITHLNDIAITSLEEFLAIIDDHKPGDQLKVKYTFRDQQHESEIRLQEDPQLIVTTFEEEGREVSDEIVAFRQSWLGSRADHSPCTLHRTCPDCGGRHAPASRKCPACEGDLLFSIEAPAACPSR